MRKASKHFKIPYTTVHRWANNPDLKVGAGRPTALSQEAEELIIVALERLASWGHSQDRDQLKDIVQSFVLATGISTSFTNGRPGPDWCKAFEERWEHRLKRRKPEPLARNRADALSPEVVTRFYALWKEILEKHNLMNKPQCIWNCDESGFSGDTSNTRVYTGRHMKAYRRVANNSKTSYSVLFCINVAGNYLPPFTLYKSIVGMDDGGPTWISLWLE